MLLTKHTAAAPSLRTALAEPFEHGRAAEPPHGAQHRGPAAYIRSKLFDLYFAGWTALFGLLIPGFWLLRYPPKAIRFATRRWAGGVLFGLKHIVGLDHHERNRARMPSEPCLIVSNHQSTWETLAFLVLFPNLAIIAKEELLSIPVFGWFLRHSPMIMIDRSEGTKSLKLMVQSSREALDAGRSVLIFPEGTRMDPSDPISFKRGVGLLYSQLGAPALPVVVNSGLFWSRHMKIRRPGSIAVSFLEPIPPGLSAAVFGREAEARVEAERIALQTA